MILVTGSTGFLGREVVGRLLRRYPDEQICLLVRPPEQYTCARTDAENRVHEVVSDIFGEQESLALMRRLKVLPGDINQDHFGWSPSEFNALAESVRSVFHCAATTTLNNEIEIARRTNVDGTRQVLRLAERSAQKFGSDFRLLHTSTAYVAGAQSNIVGADALDPEGPFRNAYERSKAESESLVRSMKDKIPLTIFRPSVIVGDSVTGQTSAFNVIYVPSKLLVKGVMSRFPALPHVPFDVVPVDYVADAIVHLSTLDRPSGACYHLTAGIGRESSPWEILEHLFMTFHKHRRRGRGYPAIPPFVSPELLAALAHSSYEVAKSSMKLLERIVCDRINVFKQMLPFIPYMMANPQFDNSETILDCEGILSQPPLFQTYAERLFKYCLDTNWGKVPWTNPSNLTLWRHRASPLKALI